MYAYRMLTHQPLRAILTVGGVALCIVLVLFLFSVYKGVADGSVEYIRSNTTDLWVLQGNATNILRGSSLLSTGHEYIIRGIPGIDRVTPVLFILASVRNGDGISTVYLTGYPPDSDRGGPPRIVEGKPVISDGDIVIDRSFAKKNGFTVGDKLTVNDRSFTVAGFSEGTNAFVIQYAFVSLQAARDLIGFQSIVTCLLIDVSGSADAEVVAETIRDELPGVAVFSHDDFLSNNIHEMESGFLPLLYTVAAIGGIVLTIILSLLLSINILERRKEFAVMKALGSPNNFIRGLIGAQALLIAVSGGVLAVLIFFPMVVIIEELAPEVGTKTAVEHFFFVFAGTVIVSMVSSFLALRRIRKIYPMEVFV
jgi:putative ABC transport system permease protein